MLDLLHFSTFKVTRLVGLFLLKLESVGQSFQFSNLVFNQSIPIETLSIIVSLLQFELFQLGSLLLLKL